MKYFLHILAGPIQIQLQTLHTNTNYNAENVLQATHINFICPMRYDSFPLDTQVAEGLKMASMGLCITVKLYTGCIKNLHYFFQRKTNSNKHRGSGELSLVFRRASFKLVLTPMI